MEEPANPPRAALPEQAGFGGLIGESSAMLGLCTLIRMASQCTSPVLILGETGTGKELVARAVHFNGSRCRKALVTVDCSALTPTLVESELFGHVKGAFTGADRAKVGLLQAANEGTVFLDEIGELPLSSQAKLLRALQEKEIRPVGSTERLSINVRVITATNRDLEAGVRAGTFRQDLYFRLNVIQIKVPTLRDRKVDIPLLVAHFLKKFSTPLLTVDSISDDALQRLMSHEWPGNVRELENVIECAVALSSSNMLAADDMVLVPQTSFESICDSNGLLSLAEVERRAILRALRESGGEKTAAARHLGIGKSTLYRKLKEYGGTLKSSGRIASQDHQRATQR